MTMEVKDGRFVARIFFVPTTFGDVLAFVFHDPDEPWEMLYRFRYYRDEKSWDSKDEKSWYHIRTRAHAELATLLPKFREPLEMVAKAVGVAPFEEVIVDSDRAEVVLARLGEQDWVDRREEAVAP